MKKILLSLSFIAVALAGKAQPCSDLIISEYVEGTGNNKALEIYNPTGASINMNHQYRLIRYNNGTSAAAGEANNQAIIDLGAHRIQSGEAWVIVIDQRNTAGTGQNAPADPALIALADTFLCPDYNVSYSMYFNGNDALSLQKNTGSGWQYVDIFGKMGDAAMTSGYGWSAMFPYDGSAAGDQEWTEDHTLIRKSSIKEGVKTNPSTFIVSTEWDSLPRNTYSNLGTHSCNCAVGIKEINKSKVTVSAYPNPAINNDITVLAGEAIENVIMYNVLGDVVATKTGNKYDKKMVIETGHISQGVYLIKVTSTGNKVGFVKVSIQ
jgi:predicted extracellular nuclease